MNQVKRIDLKENIWKDERGWGTSPIEAVGIPSELLGSIHIALIKPGCTRGNHYHTHSTEWLLIFGGSAKLTFKLADSDNFSPLCVLCTIRIKLKSFCS